MRWMIQIECEPVKDGAKLTIEQHNQKKGVTGNKIGSAVRDKEKDFTKLPLKQAFNVIVNSVKASHGWNWKPFEKDLYRKGLEMFGRNSSEYAAWSKNLQGSIQLHVW